MCIFARSNADKALCDQWRDAGVVDRGGLENRYTFGYPGFESLSLRKMAKAETSAERQRFFCIARGL